MSFVFDKPNEKAFSKISSQVVESLTRAVAFETPPAVALYRFFPELNCIVHCHSPWATSWAATLKELPHATYHSAIKLGAVISVFDTGSYLVPVEFFPKIIETLHANMNPKAFLLKGHGQIALGATPYEAFYNAELVEETAHIAIASALACNSLE